jgi:hypothetical protein
MRVAYLDEAGISATERTAVVAAVLINPDLHYRHLETYIHELMAFHVAEEHWEDFAFHAKDLIWGGKAHTAFPKSGTTQEERWPILEELLSIPRGMQLPVIVGFYTKPPPSADPNRDSLLAHSFAHTACVLGINAFMRREAEKELCMLIAEDRQDARTQIKHAHAFIRDSAFPLMNESGEIDGESDVGSHIREGIYLAAKHDGLGLQLADAIACVVRREVDGSKHNGPFIEALLGAPFEPLSLKPGEWTSRTYTV